MKLLSELAVFYHDIDTAPIINVSFCHDVMLFFKKICEIINLVSNEELVEIVVHNPP